MAYSIMMDAGHGGRDPGAVYNGRQEKDHTLRLALAVGENLQNNGMMWSILVQRMYTKLLMRKQWKQMKQE